MVAQFTTKTANSKKAIYFLSLLYYSINKLKFHVLFTSKNFVFSDLAWKKRFCSRKWWTSWRPPAPPVSTALIPVFSIIPLTVEPVSLPYPHSPYCPYYRPSMCSDEQFPQQVGTLRDFLLQSSEKCTEVQKVQSSNQKTSL